MSLLVPLAPDRHGPLARRNPLAKLGVAALLTAGLLISGDLLTPTVLLAIELAALPLTGVALRTLARRSWPLLVAVGGVAVTNLLIVDGGGSRELLDVGPFDISVRAAEAAAAVSLRLLGIALPGIVVLATTDPMDVADALVQQLHVSPRFAYGALAALRLLPLLSADWYHLARARRARGVDAGRSPVAALQLFASIVFGLLVAAIRRGVRLATAMEARGFDSRLPRSVARPQRFAAGDWALLMFAVAAVVLATVLSVWLGSWAPAFG